MTKVKQTLNENEELPPDAVSDGKTVYRVFESGAMRSRDADHARYDLIPREAMELIGRTLKKGAEKYEALNWKKGLPESDLLNHALQHIYKWIDGDRSEDHVGHALANLAFLAHFKFDEINEIYEKRAKE